VEESRALLERLERIEELERRRVGRGELLVELRALLQEAETWSHAEGGDRGASAVARLRDALARDMIAG
jgi:hypothetical protein